MNPRQDTHPLTDVGNASRFVDRHGGTVRYVRALRRWLVWDNRRWAPDETGIVMQQAKETITNLTSDAEKKGLRDLASHGRKSQSVARLRAMVELAESEPGIRVTVGELDIDPWVLNLGNGTLSLRDATLRPHQPDDLITRMAPVIYNPQANAPAWEAFIKYIMAGDADLCAYLKRVLGYTLTGDTSEHAFFVLHGAGANGKSTLLNTVRAILGDYAKATPPETFLVKNLSGPSNDLARLRGARFVTAMETEAGKRLAEALVKQLTGGDVVTARFLYQEYVEYTPQFKLFMATNYRPRIQGTDEGIWRRVHLIPFDVAIPKEEQDPALGEKLLAEAPGILRWMIEGCLHWQQGGLIMPPKVERATGGYRAEEDTLARFLEEACEMDPARRVSKSDLYNAYAGWCVQSGETAVTQKALGMYLKEQRGFRDGKSGSERHWLGIRLQEDSADDEDGTRGTY